MRSTIALLGIAAATAAAGAGVPQSVTIDFDDLQGGLFPPVVTDGLFSDFATFSTRPGSVLLVFDSSELGVGSAPNSLGAGTSADAESFDSDIFIDFTDPANNLTFSIIGDNSSGVVAQVSVDHDAGSTTLDVTGNSNVFDLIPIDLTGFTGVTSVGLINVTDAFGLGIDDVVFETVVSDGCLADFNNGGTVDILDVLTFINAWNAQDPRSDVNNDGLFNVLDVLAFITLWNAGCP